MRQLFLKSFAVLILSFIGLAGAFDVAAQSRTVVGTVTDETGMPMIGLTVIVTGTSNGATTDLDGRYLLQVPENGTLTFSYLGYETVVVPLDGRTQIDVQLQPDSERLSDAVVIGYGTTAKKDLTGSVAAVGSKDFNNGLLASPEQLINGKVAGVQIMSSSGSPTSGSTIRIRGGASLNASNDPLIVLDGIPLEIGGISGNDGNFLSMINPSDIESMTVLKDASSTAIYGSRASNGVIIITTKKGSGNKLSVNVTSTHSIQWKTKTADMLSTDEFIQVVKGLDESYTSLLGDTRTDWNSHIYTPAFGTDNLVSLSGRIVKNLPFRASVGYYNQDGILKTDNAERATANISLNPSFFDDYLKFGINVKGAYNHNRFAQHGAIWNAATFNPTIPVYSGSDAFGGYTEIVSGGEPYGVAVKNPLGLLEQTDAQSQVYRIVGNADMDYRMHFLPDLKLHLAYGYDYAVGKGYTFVPETAASNYAQKGYYSPYGPAEKHNNIFTAYLNYNTDIKKFRIDVTAGYDWQYWKATSPAGDSYNAAMESLNSAYKATDQRHALMSYYGRINLSYDSRYMITATVRRDGTSRFSNNKWGIFPSVALGWNIGNEGFLKDNDVLTTLKLRASWGQTGQQGVGGYYDTQATYYTNLLGSYYYFGDKLINPVTALGYNADLKWETTTTWNVGFDFGFLDDRITAGLDAYWRETTDMINYIPVPALGNLTNYLNSNIGSLVNKGIEFDINAIAIDTQDWTWSIGANLAYNNTVITKLTASPNDKTGVETGGISGGVGNNIQMHQVGYAPSSFYVYQQVYDTDGRPMEGVYVDRDENGVINADDKYFFHKPAADVTLGLNTTVNYKNWTLAASGHGSFGNWVYNNVASDGEMLADLWTNNFTSNRLDSALWSNFNQACYLSDYYVRNASFFKFDNITLGYTFPQLCKSAKLDRALGLNIYATIQNVATITRYDGLDPEVFSGIDNNLYPRPRTYILGLKFNF